jgi:hypothetical protein
MDKIITVVDSVTGTSTNVEGCTLYNIIAKEIEGGNIVKLSLKDCTPMSSSFMSSSFGELVDKYGMDKFREHVRLINYTPTQAERIQQYLKMLKSHH